MRSRPAEHSSVVELLLIPAGVVMGLLLEVGPFPLRGADPRRRNLPKHATFDASPACDKVRRCAHLVGMSAYV